MTTGGNFKLLQNEENDINIITKNYSAFIVFQKAKEFTQILYVNPKPL